VFNSVFTLAVPNSGITSLKSVLQVILLIQASQIAAVSTSALCTSNVHFTSASKNSGVHVNLVSQVISSIQASFK
jgi:hypothetical protein